MPLEIHIHGIDLTNMEARTQAMARPTYAALTNYVADGKPAILFVPTRRHARVTALDMLTFAAADGKPQQFLQVGPRRLHLLGISRNNDCLRLELVLSAQSESLRPVEWSCSQCIR